MSKIHKEPMSNFSQIENFKDFKNEPTCYKSP